MLERVARQHTKHGIYEDEYKVVYRADHDITDDEAQELIDKKYKDFPIIESNYRIINGNELHIFYTVDCCD